jgi:2-oxoglutarate ferredoxin oxidoreductase subunit alpha
VKIAQAHLRHLAPLPANTEQVLKGYDKVVIPEMNMGQLSKLIRADFLIDTISVNQVKGVPFRTGDLQRFLREMV